MVGLVRWKNQNRRRDAAAAGALETLNISWYGYPGKSRSSPAITERGEGLEKDGAGYISRD